MGRARADHIPSTKTMKEPRRLFFKHAAFLMAPVGLQCFFREVVSGTSVLNLNSRPKTPKPQKSRSLCIVLELPVGPYTPYENFRTLNFEVLKTADTGKMLNGDFFK